jgi:hypothetical protein
MGGVTVDGVVRRSEARQKPEEAHVGACGKNDGIRQAVGRLARTSGCCWNRAVLSSADDMTISLPP